MNRTWKARLIINQVVDVFPVTPTSSLSTAAYAALNLILHGSGIRPVAFIPSFQIRTLRLIGL